MTTITTDHVRTPQEEAIYDTLRLTVQGLVFTAVTLLEKSTDAVRHGVLMELCSDILVANLTHIAESEAKPKTVLLAAIEVETSAIKGDLYIKADVINKKNPQPVDGSNAPPSTH